MEPPVNLSLAPPTTSELAESLTALSTADCRIDAGPVPGLAYDRCAMPDCPAVATCFVAYDDPTADVDQHREGDWCPAHARQVIVGALPAVGYVDVEIRTAVTAGAEAAA
jgi:hypothetical protein